MTVVIACDPGGRYTGLVVRHRNGVVDHAVLQAHVRERRALPPARYMLEIVAWLRAAKAHVERYGHEPRIAVEGMVEPSLFMGESGNKAPLTDPATHMGLAMVYGGVMAAFPDAIEVRPAGHGAHPLRTYPAELVGAREKKGTGVLSHARSAWDIAGQAERIIRQPRLAWHTGDA